MATNSNMGHAHGGKKQLVDAGDGWTRISRPYSGKGAPRQKNSRQRSARINDNNDNIDLLAPPDASLTIAKLQEEYQRLRARWLESAHRRKLQAMLETKRPCAQWDVREAVCIALGSLSRQWSNRMRSMWQLVLFMDVLGMVRERNMRSEISVFAQEPRFTPLDVSFLSTFSIEVLEVPRAESHVNEHTFVYAPHLEWRIEIPYLKRGLMAPLYVTSSLDWVYDEAERASRAVNTENITDESKKTLEACDEAMEVTQKMRQDHWEIRFKDADYDITDCLPFSYYVRKDKEDEGEGKDNGDLPQDIKEDDDLVALTSAMQRHEV